LTDQLQREILAEAGKLAQEHEERVLAERNQEEVDEGMRRQIAKEAEDIKREHTERITAQKMQEAMLTARIDDEQEEVRILERRRLEAETRQHRIDGDLRLKIEEEASQLAEEHKSRLEDSHRQERINETVASGIEEQAHALAGEHRERRLEGAKQHALSEENRRRIDEEVAAIEREHLERLESEHRQVELDEDIRRHIDEEARKVRDKHREIHAAEAQLRMDTALLSSDVHHLGTRLGADEAQILLQQSAPAPAPAPAPAITMNMPMNMPMAMPPSAPFLSQQSSIAGLSAQSTVMGGAGAPGRRGRGAGGVRHSDDSLAKAINTFTSAAQAVSAPPVYLPSQEGSGRPGPGLGVVQMPSLKYSQEPPGGTQRAPVDLSTANLNRSSYLRQAKSHSPPRSRRGGAYGGNSVDSAGLSRRQRLRADAVNQSLESYASGKRARARSAIMSRRDQINRDTERSYYAHEQQLQDVKAGIPSNGPIPAANAAAAADAVAGGAALNTSMATSISGISDTMITYEGQPAKTRFLTPYFRKDPRAPPQFATEDGGEGPGHNRGLYGEGLWLPNTTALAPSVPLGLSRAAAARKVHFDYSLGYGAGESALTSEALARAAAAAAAACAGGSGVGESKSESTAHAQVQTQTQTQTQARGPGARPTTKSIVTSMVDRISSSAGAGAGAEVEVMSTGSVTTSQPSVEVMSQRPHRAHIAPRDHLQGSGTRVRRGSGR
jgi:hypothetical protein